MRREVREVKKWEVRIVFIYNIISSNLYWKGNKYIRVNNKGGITEAHNQFEPISARERSRKATR